jgi:hypothetical protein
MSFGGGDEKGGAKGGTRQNKGKIEKVKGHWKIKGKINAKGGGYGQKGHIRDKCCCIGERGKLISFFFWGGVVF